MTADSSYTESFRFDPRDPVFRAHEGGKLEVVPTKALRDPADLALLYTPGVADVSRAIAADPSLAARYTARSNTVAVITEESVREGRADARGHTAVASRAGRQLPQSEKAERADFVVRNDGSLDELKGSLSRFLATIGPP